MTVSWKVAWGLAFVIVAVLAVAAVRPHAAALSAVATPSAATSDKASTARPLSTQTAQPLAEVPSATVDFPPPEPTTLGKLRLTMPKGWFVRQGTTKLLIHSLGAGIFSIEQQVIALQPGTSLSIRRPTTSQRFASFSISGTTFEDLSKQMDAALPDATRIPIRVGGVDGFRWMFPQLSIVEPLANLAAVEWRGTFYVFVEHYPLDGAPGPTFQVLLDGVKLLKR